MVDSTVVDGHISHGIPHDSEVEEDLPDSTAKDAYDTLGIEDVHRSMSPHLLHESDQDVTSFLRSAGVEVTEDHHDVDMGMSLDGDLALDMGDNAEHLPHHETMMEEIMHLDAHDLHADDPHPAADVSRDPETFDFHQIHQELNDASTLTGDHGDSLNGAVAHVEVEDERGPAFPEVHLESQLSFSKTLFDSNMAPAPDAHTSHSECFVQEEPIPTGVQIVNEEILVNDVGLVPMGEGLPSTQELENMNERTRLSAQQEPGVFPSQLQDPSATAMIKTPSAGNPPLPIDHALTEPITAFYKLQFLEPPPVQTSGPHGEYRPKEAFSYYMQTLDVTIGRKINRLKKPDPEQQPQRGISAGKEIAPSGEDFKSQKADQPVVVKEEGKDGEAESAMALRDMRTNTRNNEGEDAAEEGKRSAPPEVPPAKEIAKPPIEKGGADEGLETKSGQGSEVVKDDSMNEASEIIKREEGYDRGDAHGMEDEDERQVDVDLGALKSVSRLHARIGYSYTLSQFYLDVLGRNGAWVDDVFKVKGSRVALGPYTKIQISTRTFYFILPPASIASYPIPLNHNAVTGPSAQSFTLGTGAKLSSQQATSDNEKDLHHLFQQPATFNAFSTNREEWEDERMGLFGMGMGMGKNGGYGYRSKHRKGGKCRKCKLQESEHKDQDEQENGHSFSGSDNDANNESDGSACSCSRCASEKQWMSSSVDSGADDSSELSSVSSSDEGSDEEDSDDEDDEDEDEQADEAADEEEAPVQVDERLEAKAEEGGKAKPVEEAVIMEEVAGSDMATVAVGIEPVEPRELSESVMAASDDESEEETLASKLKVAELLKPTAQSPVHVGDAILPSNFHDDGSSAMHVDDPAHFPPTEADIRAVQDLIASAMTPAGETPPLQMQPSASGMPFDSSMFSSMDPSHIYNGGEGDASIPELKLTKAEKSALAARIREAKAAARKEEQERKKAERLAQKEKEKAEKAKAKADAVAAKAAKKQKAEALEREKMLARMDSIHNPPADDFNMDAHALSHDISGDAPNFPGMSFPPGIRPGMPRPLSAGQTDFRPPMRPGMPGVRPPRPVTNGFRPMNPAMAGGASGPGVRPLRPGMNGMPIRPGATGIRPGAPGSSIRPGPGSVPPLQGQMRPGMHMRPLQPGVRPVRPGQPIRPIARPVYPSQRPPLQPHLNTGSFNGTQEGSLVMSPEGTPTRARSVQSPDASSRSPSADPSSQKRTSPLLGIDGQPFIGPEPIKPDLTYATIIYRALANVDRGRGTLGQVCDWVANEWEWFRMNPESGWQNSIRHNLSLNKAFLKVPRVPEDDPESKGSVWILDPVQAPELVERERRASEQKEARAKREAEKGYIAAKPMKPRKPTDGLPRRDSDDQSRPSPSPAAGGAPPNSVESILSGLIPPLLVPVNRQIPLMLGSIPPHLKSVDIKIKHLLPEPPYVFDNNTIILNSLVFGRFSKQQLAQMQALPTKSAMTVLRTYVLRWLQEKVKKLGPASVPRVGSPAIRPGTAPGGRPVGISARPGMGNPTPRPQGSRPGSGPGRPLPPGVRPQLARPGMVPRPGLNGASIRPGVRPSGVTGAPGVRPPPRPVNGSAYVPRPAPTPALDPETLRKITQLAESAIKTNSAQSANAKVLLQYLKQVGSQVNIAIATQILSTGVIPPNAIPARSALPSNNGAQSARPPPGPRPPMAMPRPNPSTVLGKRPADAVPSPVTDSTDAKRQKV